MKIETSKIRNYNGEYLFFFNNTNGYAVEKRNETLWMQSTVDTKVLLDGEVVATLTAGGNTSKVRCDGKALVFVVGNKTGSVEGRLILSDSAF